MRRLTDTVTVSTPDSFALAYVTTYFLDRGASGDARLPLRFPLPNFPVRGLTVEKLVALKISHGPLDADTKTMNVAWEPLGTTALPSFNGSLSATPEGTERCRLTIAGAYTPPGEMFGKLFDSVIGVRIAQATLAALLADLKRGIEADYLARLNS